MHFASFVLTLVPLFVGVSAKGGFTATCTDVSFAPGPNVQANCQSTAGVVFTSVNLNKCIAQNGNKLQCAHNPEPFFTDVCTVCSGSGTLLTCNCAGVTESIDVNTCIFNDNGQLNC